MRETKFIEQNQEKWAEFEQILRHERNEPERLNDLFIQITDDLSYARTYYPNRSVRMYLNSLAQRVFHMVYRGKRFPKERLKQFWTDELPHLMWEERRALALAFSIFVLAFTIGLVSSIIYPDFARVILGNGYVDMTLQNIQNGDPMAVYKESKPLGMTLGIAFNNLRVALMTAVLGVLGGLGTVFLMLYNGIMVGAFQYFFIEKGVFWQSFLTIWIHGTLEIGAIIIAGAAGLVAGSGLLFPGTYRRSQAFQRSLRRALKILFGIAPIIILAAIFEGYFTRYTGTPAPLRAMFILVSLAFMLWYFVWYPYHKAHSGGFSNREYEKELPPDRLEAIDFGAIKTAGEILSDAFTVIRRQAPLLYRVVLGATGLFVTYVYGLKWTRAAHLFLYKDEPLGVISGCASFFMNETAPLLWYLQLLLMAGLSFLAILVLEREMPVALQSVESRGRILAGLLAMVFPAAVMAGIFALESGFWSWALAMGIYPIVGLWCAVLFFETANPLTALIRAMRLMQGGQGVLLGILTVNLGLLVFVFLDTPVWSIILQLFGWMAPPVENGAAIFKSVANTVASSILIYTLLIVNTLCGGLFYHSCREVADADTLHAGIGQIGEGRKIRGLARE